MPNAKENPFDKAIKGIDDRIKEAKEEKEKKLKEVTSDIGKKGFLNVYDNMIAELEKAKGILESARNSYN
jgi:hypothetical protein